LAQERYHPHAAINPTNHQDIPSVQLWHMAITFWAQFVPMFIALFYLSTGIKGAPGIQI
jgi:hypothetical protein